MDRPEKLFKIGEVMEFSGLSRQTLHNYTMAGLLEEAKRTSSGHRLYDESVFETIDRIKLLQAQGNTLQQIKESLETERQKTREAEKQQLSIDFEEDE